jgi:uncharacterized protein
VSALSWTVVPVYTLNMKSVPDPPKRTANIKKHGLDLADVEDRFDWETALIGPARPSQGRARFVAVGFLAGDLVTLIFSPLGTEAIAPISLRPASRKERRRYDACIEDKMA